MTLDEAIQEFEFDCKIRHLSPKTIDNYKKQLRYNHDQGIIICLLQKMIKSHRSPHSCS